MTCGIKKDLKYYVPLCMGFIIMLIGLLCPPIGSIPTSAIYGGGCFLILCATVAGLDVPAALREIRLLRDGSIKQMLNDSEDK